MLTGVGRLIHGDGDIDLLETNTATTSDVDKSHRKNKS